MDDWRTASTRVAAAEAKATRPGGRIISPPRREPSGTLHAYRAGDDRTACGRPVGPLRKWPARRFLSGFSRQRCADCLEVARG